MIVELKPNLYPIREGGIFNFQERRTLSPEEEKEYRAMKFTIHPYLIFDFEMKAMRNFIAEVKKLKQPFVNPDQEFFSFMDKLVPSAHWMKFHFDLNATKKEKWVYLSSLGLGIIKIREVTGGSPNWIAEEIKNPSNYRHYAPDESLDYLIEAWKPYRKLIPNEFFIKYLK